MALNGAWCYVVLGTLLLDVWHFAFLVFGTLLLGVWCSWHSVFLCLVLLALYFSLLSALLTWSLALLGATSCFYISTSSNWFWMQHARPEKTRNLDK
jgi:hypothetical protein